MWRTMLGKATTILLLAAALLLGARPAAADREAKREKIREKIKEKVTAKIIDELNLDEAGVQKLFPVMDKYEDQIAALQKDNGEARRELRNLIDADKVDDKKIEKQIDRIAANRTKIATLEADLIKEVRKILTPTQAAKLVVIMPLIRERMERMIRRAAKGEGPGKGRPGRRGGGPPPDDDEGVMWDQLDPPEDF
jgi:Spy/CpxP family protein refolding chaperone